MSGEIGKFIDREWISRSETETIIKETADSILRRKRNKLQIDSSELVRKRSALLKRFLNETINYAVSFQLLSLFSEEELMKLKSFAGQFNNYADMIDKLKRIGFPLRGIPLALQEDAKELSAVLEKRDWSQRYRGDYPWESIFYPEMLALYFVAFGEEPRSTANPTYSESPGATVFFFHFVLEYIHDAQSKLKYDEHFKDLSKDELTWKIPTEHDLRNRISKWKKHPRNACEDQKAWRVNAKFYESFL